MNTNDFYKELFEKYALDEEKIRRNAIKAAKTPAWQRAVGAHWKSAVGAAAAVAVTVGAVAYTVGNNAGNIDIDPQENLLSASQRLRDAEQNYMSAATEDESKAEIYVTFIEDICFSDMSVSLSALPESEEIVIECLYLNDGTVIRGAEEIEAYAETSGNLSTIAGAKLSAPVRSYRDIQDLSKVYLAELGSDDINDETFSPIDYDDVDPLRNAYEFISTTALAESTTTPFSFESEVTSDTVSEVTSSDDTTEPPEDTEELDPVDEPEDDEETDEPDEGQTEETEESSTDVSETSAPEEESEPAETEVTTAETTVASSEITDPPEVGLMTQIYQLNVENALDTLLIKDNAIVLTRNEVYIYKVGGIMSGIENVYEISNPKVTYTDENTVIITGCGASGRRNTILVLDIKRGSADLKDAGESLGEAEIGTVNCSTSEGKYFLKAVSASTTYVYELMTGDDGIQFRPLFESAGVVSPAGYRNGWLWYTAADESMRYNLYSFNCSDGSTKLEYNFGSVCKVRRSKSFDSFIISTNDSESSEPQSYVFDTARSQLVPVAVNGEAMIAVKNGTIYVGFDGKNYTVSSEGVLTEAQHHVDYVNKPVSKYTILSSDSEKVVVAEKTDAWSN
ncbi:MAG: hypothetical protein J6O50_07325 [Ruminiclostridium sp.]|nr:hypothetical protein [Ruminiclostridium sp.]